MFWLLWEDGKVSGSLLDGWEVGGDGCEDDGNRGEEGGDGAVILWPSSLLLILSSTCFNFSSRFFSFSVFLEILSFVWQGQSEEEDISEDEEKYFSFK